ncbi:hypothetical protein ES705_48333 [subsurface metagenome]
MDYHNEINGYQISIFGQANHFPQMENGSIYIEQIEGSV